MVQKIIPNHTYKGSRYAMAGTITDSYIGLPILSSVPIEVARHNVPWSEKDKVFGEDFGYFFIRWENSSLDVLGITYAISNLRVLFLN